MRHQQDTDTEQRDLSPEDKPGDLNHAGKFPPCLKAVPPGNTSQRPPITESALPTHPASKLDASLTAPEPCLSFYPQPPLPGRGRAGGRLGVSFCFSRRGPRLEPSAPLFSDLEEEEREKRKQMKERIKGIMEDICREIAELEGRKDEDGGKLRSLSGSGGAGPFPSEASREKGEIENGEMGEKPAQSDNSNTGSPSQSQDTIWNTEPGTNAKHTDKEAEKEQESERAGEESQDMCVLGKDGSTCLRWPSSLLKFTTTQPCISYSHNPLSLSPQPSEGLTDGVQQLEHQQLSPLSDSNPIILTPDIHTLLEQHNREDLPSSRKEEFEHFETKEHLDREIEHLCLNKTLSPPETALDKRRSTTIIESSVRASSHPFDYSHCDSSSSTSQNLQGGRLTGVTEISERPITRSESVTHTGVQAICTSPSRCECRCEPTVSPQPRVGVSRASRRNGKASVKKQKPRKKKKSKKEKASNKRQSARRRVRSVVSTVSTGGWRVGESAESWGKTKNRRKVKSTVTSCLLGKWEGEPISVSVRKRRPQRSNSSESQSEAEREQREHRRASSQLRLTADTRPSREGRPGRRAANVPWRSHISLHSFSSGCNSELFWEGGHHSNPRSFIDCCYPDNSCGCSPPRKRKVLHRDRLFIQCKRRSLRHREVWEETARGRKRRGPSGSRDRGLNADTEQWDWMRGSCPRGLRSRNKTEEWDQMTGFSPSPSRWSRGSRQISTDDADWDRCSVDRWTWSSNDSAEDGRTPRSVPGSRTQADSRGSPDSVGKCARTVHLRSKHLFSTDWWTSRQTSSPQCVMETQARRGCSPGSCSPCSSTGVSELSWDWSRSSTCSGAAADGSTVSPCAQTSGTRGLSFKGRKEQKSPVSSGITNSSETSPHRSYNTPTVPELHTPYCDQTLPQLKEHETQCEALTPVMTSGAPGAPGLSPDKSRSQKSSRMSLLPLIGKLPAIQKKAERRKALLCKSQQKEKESGAEGLGVGRDAEEVTSSPTEPNSRSVPSRHLSEIRTGEEQAAGQTAPPISFTPEEMDKYRLLQEQAREHMQKVLEQMQDAAATQTPAGYTHAAQPADNRGTLEHYTPVTLQNPPQPQIRSRDSVQTQPQHNLQVTPALPHLPSLENFPDPLALGHPGLPPLPPSASLRSLPHVLLRHAAVSMPAPSPSTSTPSPSAPIHPHPARLPHPPHPLHPSLPLPLPLSPFSISSLFPSILLSHSPLPLLQSPAFHVSPVAPLSAVALQPLTLQPFMDRAWPVRFQQKAL